MLGAGRCLLLVPLASLPLLLLHLPFVCMCLCQHCSIAVSVSMCFRQRPNSWFAMSAIILTRVFSNLFILTIMIDHHEWSWIHHHEFMIVLVSRCKFVSSLLHWNHLWVHWGCSLVEIPPPKAKGTFAPNPRDRAPAHCYTLSCWCNLAVPWRCALEVSSAMWYCNVM